LTAIQRVKPVIEEFRRDVQTPGGKTGPVRDSTRFTLDDLLTELQGEPLV
jgi:hypothetical protein